MKSSVRNTGSIVLLSYCLLVTLALVGIVTIYSELIKSQQQSQEDSSLRKELIDLNNTLTTMYHIEGTAGLLAFADNDKLKVEYDSLTTRVFEQIDSLRFISNDSNINLNLDTLSTLLSKKYVNTLEMFQLTKQIDKNIEEEIHRTIITRNDVEKLNTFLADVMLVKEDTVQIVAERRGFLQRVRDVVRPNTDTLTQISRSTISETTELSIPLLSDTIVDFIRRIDRDSQKKNTQIIQRLITHQHELYTIQELAGQQIYKIIDVMKEREYQSNVDFLKDKNESLTRSSTLVAIVGITALVVVVFFMSWVLQSLRKEQRLQKNIREAKKHTEKLLLSREQLIYTITHDIKAPLSSIIGFLDLLLSEVSLSQKQLYYINNMYSSASHIQALVRNLLDFSSIEKEHLQPNFINFSPDSLIHNIYESFLPLSEKKKLVFDLKSSFPKTNTYSSDPYFIRQIVNNLISNAIKFTPEEGQIMLSSSEGEQNSWKISVQDTGPGIDPADQLKIFDEFVRLGDPKEEIEGTGLGLTISEKLAKLLGGTVEVKSQKGSGSTFILIVPLTPVMEKMIQLQDKTFDITSARILFVDDDQVQLNLLSELMRIEAWPCICCSSTHKALELVRETPFDIIFTDIHIPEMEGFEFVRRIRESNFPKAATIPVIAFSADYQNSESELSAAGFTEFLQKPFSSQQLLKIIEKYTSFQRKSDNSYPEKESIGWKRIFDFVIDDQEAAMKIIDSFIEETKKNKELLKTAFQKKNNKDIKIITHKMLSLMRMLSAQEIISILVDIENGAMSKEKKETLFYLLDEILKEAEVARQTTNEPEIINN